MFQQLSIVRKGIFHEDGSPCYVKWYRKGRLHNRFGPAVKKYDCCGTEEHELFYLNGKYLSRKQHQNKKDLFVMNSTVIVLFVVFLVLKLVGVIAWSWWWVTAPLWIGWAIALLLFLIVGLFATKKSRQVTRDFNKGWGRRF